ncbi:MAG: helix-turn-helix domain-containing protein [Tetragenococcus halophilus]|nr:helix-turn-helix domain-containing protein [Tetragenococcus halophilus]
MGIPKLRGTYQQRIELVEKYLRNEISLNAAAKEAHVHYRSIKHWVTLYENEGPEGLRNKKKLRRYPRELKLQATEDYLDGQGSLESITKKYGIRSPQSLREWVKTYNTYGGVRSVNRTRKKSTNEG